MNSGLVLHVLYQSLSRPIPYRSLRGPYKIYTASREAASLVGWVGGLGRRKTKVSFNSLYTSWVHRSCIYLLIYVIQFCHQHSYGFQNLISSWRVGILFLKLLWENVFFKNHAKSKVFQNTPSYTPFLNNFFQFEQNFDIFSQFV